MHQNYPRDRMEWIIIDDGTDPIGDLVKDVPGVKYFKYDEKMSLGKKRNLMHEKSSGDIIVYMDDDDYYPPQRVPHAVDMLTRNKKALCAGSSQLCIWFKHIQQMYQFGPYGPNHATAGTFAFKRELLEQTSYEDGAALAEEKHFLKNYTVPFVQLNPRQTILVFSHEHNTFDKRKLLKNKHPKYVKESEETVDDYIKEPDMKQFYMHDIEDMLRVYEPGLPKHKPDVLKQTAEIEERRRKKMEEMQKQRAAAGQGQGGDQGTIVMEQSDGTKTALTNHQIVEIIQKQKEQLTNNKGIFDRMQQQIQSQQNQLIKNNEIFTNLQQQIQDQQKIIEELREQVKSKSSTNDCGEEIEAAM
jgi:hypothetical protein